MIVNDCGFTTTLGVRLTPVDWNKIHDEVRKFNVDFNFTCDKEPLMTFILPPFIAIKTTKRDKQLVESLALLGTGAGKHPSCSSRRKETKLRINPCDKFLFAVH